MRSLDRDGVALAYRDTGGEGRSVVFVHGWCCDHTYFAPQFEHFARLGYRVVAVDLRGHGRSSAPRQAYAMQAFADDVAWMCESLDLEKPILIGHSMGGIVCFDLVARYPGLAAALVMLDAAIVLPSEARAAIPAFLDGLRDKNYRDVLQAYVGRALFVPTDDAAIKSDILSKMAGTAQHVMLAAFEGLRDYDPEVARKGLRVPALYVAADEPVARSDMARLRELVPQLHYGRTVGSGHFCQIEVPEQVHAMIDRFLRVSGL